MKVFPAFLPYAPKDFSLYTLAGRMVQHSDQVAASRHFAGASAELGSLIDSLAAHAFRAWTRTCWVRFSCADTAAARLHVWQLTRCSTKSARLAAALGAGAVSTACHMLVFQCCTTPGMTLLSTILLIRKKWERCSDYANFAPQVTSPSESDDSHVSARSVSMSLLLPKSSEHPGAGSVVLDGAFVPAEVDVRISIHFPPSASSTHDFVCLLWLI
eukprot:5999989-Pleurochrysis_carterae.AAC.2